MLNTEAWQPGFVGEGNIRYYNYARYAIVDALILSGVRVGSVILLPEYLCRDLLATLNLLGAKACWYPVKPNLLPANPSKDWPIADVVLAVDYFGFPQDLNPFFEYSKRTGALIIEDNAHGYLSRDEDGKWLGCRTGLGVFSLRKTFRIPDGGALWIGAEYAEYDLPVQSLINGFGSNRGELIKAKLRGLPFIGEFFYRLTIEIVRVLRKWRTGSFFPLVDSDSEKKLPMKENPWSGLLSHLSRSSTSDEIARRRKAYKKCEKFAKLVGAKSVFNILPINCVPYAYAFRCDTFVLNSMRNYAKREGFDLVSWPDLPDEVQNQAPEYYRNVFLINFLW